MFEKTLLAFATAAAIVGFAGLMGSTPAAAQGMYNAPQRHWRAPGPGYNHPPRVRGPGYNNPPRVRGPGWHTPPRHRWVHRPPHRRWGYRYGYGSGYAPGVYFYTPGVYTSDCRLVKRRVRVLTDTGWHLRWRYRRVCY